MDGDEGRAVTPGMAFIQRPGFYWFVFSLILAWGVVSRIAWTYLYGVPIIQPDSFTYWLPAVSSPLWPWSWCRTAGYPFLIVLGLGLFHHPVGILILQNVLTIAAALFLHYAIRTQLHKPWLATLMLIYSLLFLKGIQGEYLMLSEAFARVTYLSFLALIILIWTRLTAPRAAILCAVTLISILIRPAAIALVPIFPITLLLKMWAKKDLSLRTLFVHSGLFLSTIAVVLLIYSIQFQSKYRYFGLTAYSGFALFVQAAQYIDFQSPRYADLKQELKPLIDVYREKYSSRRQYQMSWLIYGTMDDQLRTDFGDNSPAKIIKTYAEKHPGDQILPVRINGIYYDLAKEGIAAHLPEYLLYGARRTAGLLYYGGIWDDKARDPYFSTKSWDESRAFYMETADKPQPFAQYDLLKASIFFRLLAAPVRVLAMVMGVATKFLVCLAGIALIPLLRKSTFQDHRGPLTLLFIVSLIWIFYCALLGYISSADPGRYFLCVQDTFIFSVLFALDLGLTFLLKSKYPREIRPANHQLVVTQ